MKYIRFCLLLLLIALPAVILAGCEQPEEPASDVSSAQTAESTLRYVCKPEGAGYFKGETTYALSKGQTGGYLTVIPNDGYDFVKWSDGSTDPMRGADSLKSGKDTVITAEFTTRPFVLRYEADSPIGGSIYGETEQYLKYGEKSSAVTAVPAAYYTFAGWSDGLTDYTREGDSIESDKTIYALFEHTPIEVTVPTLYLITGDGKAISNKDTYRAATLKIEGSADGKYDAENLQVSVKGRGNSSWSNSAIRTPTDHKSKNSYNLKLNEKMQLLGLGGSAGSKNWVLNSGKYDESGLRNWICWRLGELMDGVPFSIDMTWVRLVVNGEYRGLYLLTEKVEASKSRVNIEAKDPSVLDKGYLLQLDKRAEGTEGWDYFTIDGYYGDGEPDKLRPFVIENGIESVEQLNYIREYVKRCHDAILTGDEETIKSLVDIDSFFDMFCIEELSKDVDANFASFYMYKAPGGKLTLTSPWDFDFGFGTYSSAMVLNDLMCEKTIGNLWFQLLMKTEWFPKQLRERMDKITPLMRQVRDEMWAMEASLQPYADENDEKWTIYGNHYAEYVASGVSTELHSYHEHLQFLNDWLIDRWDLLLGYVDKYVAGEGTLQK